jgi:hypothetical protein
MSQVVTKIAEWMKQRGMHNKSLMSWCKGWSNHHSFTLHLSWIQNILNHVLLKSLHLGCSIRMNGQASQPYKTTSKIIVSILQSSGPLMGDEN